VGRREWEGGGKGFAEKGRGGHPWQESWVWLVGSLIEPRGLHEILRRARCRPGAREALGQWLAGHGAGCCPQCWALRRGPGASSRAFQRGTGVTGTEWVMSALIRHETP
jgi:hypothetical protein